MVLLFIAAVLTGMPLGYGRGGQLRRMQHLRFRRSALLVGAVTLQVGFLPLASRRASPPLLGAVLLVSYVLLAVWVVLNTSGRHGLLRMGMCAAAVGTVLNVLAIAPGGRMPVSADAAARAATGSGVGAPLVDVPKHVTVTHEGTPLGDVLPLSAARVVLSVGDLLLLCGVGLLTAGAMCSEAVVPGSRLGAT